MYNPNIYYPGYTSFPGYAGGGHVAQQQRYGLAAAAEQLRRRGREGDTILAHISPQEAGILKLLGGSGGVNPHTGLPEFKKFWKNITAKNVAAPVAATVAFVASGGNPAAAAAAAGAVKAAQGASVKEIATTAALTFAGSSIGGAGAGGASGSASSAAAAEATKEALAEQFWSNTLGTGTGSAAGAGAGAATGSVVDPGITLPPPTAATAPTTVTPIPADAGLPSVAPPPAAAAAPAASAGLSGYDLSYSIPGASPATSAAAPISDAVAGVAGTSTGAAAAPSTAGGIANLAGAAINAVTPSSIGDAVKLASTAALGYGAIQSAEETKKQREAAQAELARQAAKRAEDLKNAQTVMANYPFNWRRGTAEDIVQYGIGAPRRLTPQSTVQAAGGGAIDDLYPEYGEDSESEDEEMTFDDSLGYDYARGGIAALPPQFLSGGGDGMSDSIPARISGKQEARLADGEFIIPADIVSHIGNGSSNAGAKKLYAMMDRIRRARTGKAKQAPAINARRLMPA